MILYFKISITLLFCNLFKTQALLIYALVEQLFTLLSDVRREADGKTAGVLTSSRPLEPMCFPATGDNGVCSTADSARSPSLSPGTAGWFICSQQCLITSGYTTYHNYHRLPSTRQHLSYGDYLEFMREYYQNCSVLNCVTQCSQSAADLYEQFLQVQQIGFFTLGPLCCAQRQMPRVVLL